MTGSSLPNVVIVGAARTPMGGLMGTLSSVSAPELGSCAIKAAVARSTLQASDIEEVIMGCVLPAGLKQGPAPAKHHWVLAYRKKPAAPLLINSAALV